ncbi:MAG: Ig-like domain-containing protein, partial [Chryseolinea sp.]
MEKSLPKFVNYLALICFLLIATTLFSWAQPTFTSVPAGGATGVNQSGDIVLTFSELIRDSAPGDATITDSGTDAIDNHITLKITDGSGADIPFDATINAGKTVVTINPSGNLPSGAIIFIAVADVENGSNTVIAPNPTSFTFTVVDYVTPTITFSPIASAVNVSVASNLVVSFDETVRNINDSDIDNANVGSLLTLKLTNAAGADVPFIATINGSDDQITIDPTSNLNTDQVYYLSIAPVEDASNNATTAANITFTTIDTQPPVPTFNPLNGATGVIETNNIVINFNEAIRRASDDANLTNTSIDGRITLKITDASGTNIPFDATINGSDDQVTIDPTSVLPGNTVIYVAIAGVEDSNNNLISPDPASITFTTGDTQPPTLTFSPFNTETNVSVSTNLTITFNEAIRNLDNSAISAANLLTLVNFKLTNAGGADVPFVASIDGTNKIVTIDPSSNLAGNQVYFLGMNPIEDGVDNATSAQSITFTSEAPPSFTGSPFSPVSTCVNDNIVISGGNFGAAVPTVTINSTSTTPAEIIAHTNTSITFKTLAGMAGSGLTVTVLNNTNGLSSTSVSTLTINPAINLAMAVSPSNAAPAVNQNYSVLVGGSTQSTVSYRVRRISPTIGSFTSAQAGNGGQLTFGPFTQSASNTYVYEVEASSINCTTLTLTQTATFTIASLSAFAGSDKIVCEGQGVTIGGSPAAVGGTGFHSYSWSPTTGLSCINCPNPVASPTVNTTYTLTVDDDNGDGPVTDDVDIVVRPVPKANFLATVKSNFADQDSVYLLSNKVKVNPSGGKYYFSGLGVSQHSDTLFYFDPKTVGAQSDMPITFTYTYNGCQSSDVLKVNVTPANAILGLETYYCSNRTMSNPLKPNLTYLAPFSYQYWDGLGYGTVSYTYTFKRLGYYSCDAGDEVPVGSPNYPLSPTGNPQEYLLDINKVANSGYLSNCFYILIVADQHVVQKNSSNVTIYDQTSEGWPGYGYFQITNIGKPPVITSIADNQAICSDNLPIKLVTNVPSYITNSYTINDGTDNSITTAGPDYFFDPSEITFAPSDINKPFTITYNYNDDNFAPVGGCPNTVTRDFFVVNKVKAPTALDQQYCQNYQDRRVLTVSSDIGSTEFHWYDGPTEVGQGPVFDTQISTVNPTNKTYTVKQALYGCQGLADNSMIIIVPAPVINLTTPPLCEDVMATFFGPSTNTISWEWTLGDDTVKYLTQNVNHVYTTPGVYTLSLLVKSNTNGQVCTASATYPITVGQNPKPDFGYNFLCEGDATRFSGKADIPVKDFQWSFGDGDALIRKDSAFNIVAPNNNGGRTSGKYSKPFHTYGASGQFTVSLTTYTNLGCSDSIKKVVSVLPYIKTLSSTTPYEMSALNGGDGFWSVEDLKDSTTWEFATPTKTIINSSSNAWVTNASGNYNSNDASVVNSPCLDISGFQRPVISFDFISNTQQKSDGAVLEYSTNGGVKWNALGAPGSGQNWFNTTGFFSGKIGDSQVGWSGDMAGISNEWLEGKRALDDEIALPNRSKVRFRIAFGSNGDGESEGFAFNNVTITERNRLLLLENFTNESEPEYTANNNAFKGLASTEVVKLQYNLSFPGPDPVSSDNLTDPNARAAFYGISNGSQLIPRAYIDGVSEGNLTNNWFVNYSALRSLNTSPFSISIIPSPSVNPGELTVSVSAKALQNIISPIFNKPVIHIAIVEKTVGNNKFVLRKLLPNAAGTPITLPLLKNDSVIVGPKTWQVTNTTDPADLAIIAFVQDEVTKE